MGEFEQAVDAEQAAATSSTEPQQTDQAPAPTGEDGQQAATGEQGEQKPTVKLPASIKPPQKNGRFQQRISDLVQSRKAAEEENRRLRDEVAQLRGGVQRPGTQPAAGQGQQRGAVDPNAQLNHEDFETYSDYVNAVVQQSLARQRQAESQQSTEAAYEKYRAEKQEEFQTHAAPLAEAYGEGFWDAITDPTLPVSEAMADAVVELGEMAPYTMLWLAANRQEAQKLFHMNPRQATIAIGRLAAKLTMELQQDGGQAGQPAAGQEAQQAAPQASAPAIPQRPRPTPVQIPRGSAPANNLGADPNDKDDAQTWLAKETARMRQKFGPSVKFYGA